MMRSVARIALVLLVFAGCLGPASHLCEGEVVCPADKACVAGGGCASPEQLAACEGVVSPGHPCAFGREVGECINGVCIGSLCGNGTLDPGERCDDGNRVSGDGCRGDCLKNEGCGDAVIDAGEACDAGSINSNAVGAPCRPDCTLPRCGDGVVDVNAGEACEPGQLGTSTCQTLGFYQPAGLACNAACGFDTSGCTGGRCGDGILEGNEVCDGAPPTTSCLDYGYDAGALGCAAATCTPSFAQCESLTWTSVYTAPAGLTALWGTGATDIFAVGGNGTIVHFDGTTWTAMTSNTTASLDDVWGSGPHDVFAVGGAGTIVHYDGASWSIVGAGLTTEAITAVWGSSATDVFAVGPDYHVLHYDGSAWSYDYVVYAQAPVAIWGSGPNDIYAGGNQNLIHFDGTAWSEAQSLSGVFIAGIWGSGPDDVFVTAASGGPQLRHFDGATWTLTSMPQFSSGLWGNGDDVYAASRGTVLHYDRDHLRSWSRTSASNISEFADVWGSGRGDVYAVGDGQVFHGGAGVVHAVDTPPWIQQLRGNDTTDLFGIASNGITHYDGSVWSIQVWSQRIDDLRLTAAGALTAIKDNDHATYDYDGSRWIPRPTNVPDSLDAMWGSGPNDTYGVGANGQIVRLVAGQWVSVHTGAGQPLYDVWGSGPDDVFAVGDFGTILHFDGNAWTKLTSNTSSAMVSVWGSGPGDVYAVGYPGVQHYDGSTWSLVGALPAGAMFSAVWGSGPNDVFVAKRAGEIDHWNGATWTPMTTPEPVALLSLWGRGPNDVYAGGWSGVYHYDGATWTALAGAPAMIYTIVGDAIRIVAGGEYGVVAQYDGATWTPLVYAENPGLSVVVGVGSGQAYAAGDAGLARYDGSRWTILAAPPASQSFYAVWGSSPTDVFAVGSGGTILHWDGVAATTTTAPTTDPLFAVWGSGPHDVFAANNVGIIHFDGTAWSTMTLPAATTGARTLFGSGPGDVYCLTDQGVIRWNGSSWTLLASTLDAKLGWAFAPDDVYVFISFVGLRHWNGAVWEPVRIDAADLRDMWGNAGSLVIVTDTGEIERLVGHLRPRTASP